MHVKSPDAKRLHVLTASALVFGANGYSRTTMGDLAKAAGMSRPALYLVFPRKEQLFSTLLREAADSPGRTLPADGSGRGYEQLTQWLMWACALWTGRNNELSSGQADICSQSEKYSEYILIEGLLREGIQARLPLDDSGAPACDVARLIATCMRGLSEIPMGESERRRLLALQVGSIARGAGWSASSAAHSASETVTTLM